MILWLTLTVLGLFYDFLFHSRSSYRENKVSLRQLVHFAFFYVMTMKCPSTCPLRCCCSTIEIFIKVTLRSRLNGFEWLYSHAWEAVRSPRVWFSKTLHYMNYDQVSDSISLGQFFAIFWELSWYERACNACMQAGSGRFPKFHSKAGTGKAKLHHILGEENGRSNAKHIQPCQMISNFTA